MNWRPRFELHGQLEQQLAQECKLCKQAVASGRQLPFNMILIEGYGMCPNCRQQVGPETENAYWYRSRWLRFVEFVAKKNGLEYRAGYGFRPLS